ncbi:SufD family Fe-S cluster assembly protein [Candidatus Dependentiae bacterium]|nr:SufD family Fe-S cluster assembly protein [Candidatus Dependentiae bacterium]
MNPITLSYTVNNDILLSTALQDRLVDNQLPTTLSIVIEVAPNISVNLIDDLTRADSSAGIVRHSITINAQENSLVTYKLRLVESLPSLPAAVVEKRLSAVLLGKGARVDMNAACLTKHTQRITFHTLQDHVIGDSTSNVMIKAICDDASRLTCNSLIRIHPGAQGSNAEQANKNILLSKQARAVSVPQLEIEANDVRCKHGAAVSTLSNEHLFYLQSRGLSVDTAKEMLLDGFLQ